MRTTQLATWVIVGLGLAATALGVKVGLGHGGWSVAAGGLVLTVGMLPRVWNGFGPVAERRPTATVHIALWNLAMLGAIAVALVAVVSPSPAEIRVGVALLLVAALLWLISVDASELRLRRLHGLEQAS